MENYSSITYTYMYTCIYVHVYVICFSVCFNAIVIMVLCYSRFHQVICYLIGHYR